MQVRGLEPFLSPPRLLLEFMDAVQVEAVYDGDTGQRLEGVLVFPRGAAAARVRTNSFGCTLAPVASPMQHGAQAQRMVWTRGTGAKGAPAPASGKESGAVGI
mmetsp:Transcript_4265/g.14114  ORF Transcript_4265/g.14114 Transcript_4265/m.14114 type:complete len:103 (+) Transcript_4265:1260-1568(+)